MVFLFTLPTAKLRWALGYPAVSQAVEAEIAPFNYVKPLLVVSNPVTVIGRMGSLTIYTLFLSAIQVTLWLFAVVIP